MFFIGNSFPMALIRREVRIRPISLDELVRRLRSEAWLSFWGHANTIAAACAMTGCDLAPRKERPAIQVDDAGFPVLFDRSARECLILTPVYRPGIRPPIGEEVSAADIDGWQVLQINWGS